jgi:hypothetical protein
MFSELCMDGDSCDREWTVTNLFGNAHFLVMCDEELAQSAIHRMLTIDPSIQLAATETIEAKRKRDSFVKHRLKRRNAVVDMGISNGPSENRLGNQNGTYWIFIDAPFSFFEKNDLLANDIRHMLLDHGATE